MRSKVSGWVVALVALELAGCASQHIATYVPRRRDYQSPVDFEKYGGPTEKGSVFHPNSVGIFLFADQRAMRVGDIVTVRIREEAAARRDASTKLSRNGSAGLSVERLFSLVQRFGGKVADGDLLKALFSTDFAGSGETARTEHLVATVPAIVREVLPNGNLFIEGHRVILVNNEEHHFYISGVIRPVDIAGDNSVESSLIADAEIEFTGRGVITDKQRPGWLSRALDYVAPF